MTKKEQITSFDPNGVGVKGTLFGLPFSEETCEVVVIPIPWDVTASYGKGTANGPMAILQASSQLDYAQVDIPDAWKLGVWMAEIPGVWQSLNKQLGEKSKRYINWLESGSDKADLLAMQSILAEINGHCSQLMKFVEQESHFWLDQGKTTVLLGGDHSTALGHINACVKRHGSFGILQIDAHADLRLAYEGFEHSHASVMRNAMQIEGVSKLVQVGVRDYCPVESDYIYDSNGRVRTFFDQEIKEKQFAGKRWRDQCNEIVDELPEQVYISFDIDGLDPKLCPNTGTPVPGGFELDQVMHLIKEVVKSGRKIVGADLCEVAPGKDEFDANVGARALYRMVNLMAVSQGKLTLA